MYSSFYNIQSYLQANLLERERAFYHYLVSNAKAISTSVSYTKFCSTNKIVTQLVNELGGKRSLFEIVDEYTISSIYVQSGKKKAAVGHYGEFINEIIKRTNQYMTTPCDSKQLLHSCILTLDSKEFTYNDLQRFIPIFKILYPKVFDVENILSDTTTRLINENIICITSEGHYELL